MSKTYIHRVCVLKLRAYVFSLYAFVSSVCVVGEKADFVTLFTRALFVRIKGKRKERRRRKRTNALPFSRRLLLVVSKIESVF